MSRPPIVIVGGPTCTGKTGFAVALAERLGKAELINADSRQVRSGLPVGTCAPTADELRGVPCHLVGVVPPGRPYTAGDWLGDARSLLERFAQRGVAAVVVGGTGLYLRALVNGYSLAPRPDPARRAERNRVAAEPGGLERLTGELWRRDPERWASTDLRNPRRVIRALEALDAGGAPGLLEANPAAGAVGLVLDTERSRHREWVEERTRRLFAAPGIVEEAAAALSAGVTAAVLAGCGIGYAEALDVLEGQCSSAEAISRTVLRTLRYARSQRAFFRGMRGMAQVEADDEMEQKLAAVVARLPGPPSTAR
ncbi:MAG: tRNA dimethylallyltransferase [Candidatus Dormibacteraeota bacterium]|nr:tRNA dimethylallyltransferase [Candidatus Dormibacteraeota bacterium]